MEEVPVPDIGDDDALVRVLRTGICGTDLHILRWDDWAREHVPFLSSLATSSSEASSKSVERWRMLLPVTLSAARAISSVVDVGNWHGRSARPVREYGERRRHAPGRVCRLRIGCQRTTSGVMTRASTSISPRSFDPDSATRSTLPRPIPPRRGRPRHRLWPDWSDGGDRRAPRRRSLHRRE